MSLDKKEDCCHQRGRERVPFFFVCVWTSNCSPPWPLLSRQAAILVHEFCCTCPGAWWEKTSHSNVAGDLTWEKEAGRGPLKAFHWKKSENAPWNSSTKRYTCSSHLSDLNIKRLFQQSIFGTKRTDLLFHRRQSLPYRKRCTLFLNWKNFCRNKKESVRATTLGTRPLRNRTQDHSLRSTGIASCSPRARNQGLRHLPPTHS